MAAMWGGPFRKRQMTRLWTNNLFRHVPQQLCKNSMMLRLSVYLVTEKLQPPEFQVKGVDKTYLYLEKKGGFCEKQKQPRVLPILLLWETLAEVFSCKSGIHFNNLKHKWAALKINVMASTPAAREQRSDTFNYCTSEVPVKRHQPC